MKYILILTLISFFACAQTPKKNSIIPPSWDYYLTSKEASRYAFFKFDLKRDDYIFNKNSKPATLSNIELLKIEKLIAKRVREYNKRGIDIIKKPEMYYKQFITIINGKGEKEVWVNCCCAVMHGGYWKTSIERTMDGGSCYFTIKINLTKNKAYKLNAHGLA